MDLRRSFISDYEAGVYTFVELCRSYGISRTAGYKWVERHSRGEGLEDRSRRPHGSPKRTPDSLVDRIVEARARHPDWGPDKIRAVLSREAPGESWPSGTTIGEILRRRGMVASKGRRRRSSGGHPGPVEAEVPNEVWASDFKGEFLLGNRSYCYPLTVTDRHSRLILGCEALSSTGHEGAQAVFARLFGEYGLPRVMLTDNGVPFGTRGLGGLSRLTVWWIRLGIVPVRIEPGNPQQNGGHERMHRTLAASATRPPGRDFEEQQGYFDAFQRRYNQERPHEALGYGVPAERYEVSPREFPKRLSEPEYPGHFEERVVQRNGTIKWGNREHFLTTVLSGERVGLEEVDEGIWSLCLSGQILARYDAGRDEWTATNRPLCWLSPLARGARSESQQSG